MELQGKHFVLGLTGGIACYKSAELVRLLTCLLYTSDAADDC